MRIADLGRKLLLAAAMVALLALALFAARGGSAGLIESAAAQVTGGVEISPPPVTVAEWSTSGGDRPQPVTATLTVGGAPVSGALVMVGGYRLAQPTDPQGRFVFPVDRTAAQRYPVKVIDAGNATAGGRALSNDQRAALLAADGGINVYYDVRDVSSAVQPDGTVAVSGTLTFASGKPPTPIELYAFRLAGTVRDTAGKPVQGVLVTTKVEDRWSVSNPTDANGNYTSFFWPTAEAADMRVAVYEGDNAYLVPGGQKVTFPPLTSAGMDITVDRAAGTIAMPQPKPIEGVVYDALLVGPMQGGKPVKPVSATWNDQKGHFTMVLPAGLAGQRIEWWEAPLFYFSTGPGKPGSPVDLAEWPAQLGPRVAQGVGSVNLAAKR
jgi:hypothetical protein